MVSNKPTSIEEYLAGLSDEQRAAMDEIRAAVEQAAPRATEAFSYRLPAFKSDGRMLVWYAAFSDHYSLYPATEELRRRLGDRLVAHLSGKGTLRFDAREPIPVELIRKIVEVRLSELQAGQAR